MVRVDGEDNGGTSLIRVRGLDKTYRRGSEDIHVLQGLNLDVDAGDFVAFMGPSGSGKTTLLNLLGGLDVPSAGSIVVAGDEITHMSAGKLTAWRARHVGFVFQMYNLIPVLSAFQNVELPLLLTQLSPAARRRHVETALAVVGLADRMRHYPRQLSGGHQAGQHGHLHLAHCGQIRNAEPGAQFRLFLRLLAKRGTDAEGPGGIKQHDGTIVGSHEFPGFRKDAGADGLQVETGGKHAVRSGQGTQGCIQLPDAAAECFNDRKGEGGVTGDGGEQLFLVHGHHLLHCLSLC